jgi:hypothetical protein
LEGHQIYLKEESKKVLPGFDFGVKYSSDGTPEGLIWMTPNIREEA